MSNTTVEINVHPFITIMVLMTIVAVCHMIWVKDDKQDAGPSIVVAKPCGEVK